MNTRMLSLVAILVTFLLGGLFSRNTALAESPTAPNLGSSDKTPIGLDTSEINLLDANSLPVIKQWKSEVKIQPRQGDTTPPVLSSVQITPSFIQNGGIVTISIQASDLSGIATIFIYDLFKPDGTNFLNNIVYAMNFDPVTQRYIQTYQISPFAPSGTWKIGRIHLRDKLGNEKYYQGTDFGATFQVSSTQSDTTAPVLRGVNITPNVLVNGGTITISVDATDDLSGIATIFIYDLFKPDGTNFLNNIVYAMNFDPITQRYIQTYQISPFAPSGAWKIGRIHLRDKLGNEKYYQGTDFGATLQVSSTQSDTTAPVLRGVNITPNVLVNGGTITISVDATDDLSGIATIFIYDLFKPDGSNFLNNIVYAMNFDPITQRYIQTYELPSSAPWGIWKIGRIHLRDKLGNEKYYQGTDFGATFQVGTVIPTPTLQPTNTPTVIRTSTPTSQPTNTPTVIPTATSTKQPTPTPTRVASPTGTVFPTSTPTGTPTPSNSVPILQLNQSTYSFTATEGSSAPSQNLTISNSGTGTLNWTATITNSDNNWLSLSQTSGNAPATINLLVNSSELPVGQYTSQILISSNNAHNSPQIVTVTLTVSCQNQEAVDVVLVLDKSNSMEGQAFTDAKNAAISFINQMDLTHDQVGFVSFYGIAKLENSLTQDGNAVKAVINNLIVDDGTNSNSGTNIAAALNVASNELQSSHHNPNHRQVIVLLTDGEHNTNGDPIAESIQVKNNGIYIITIGLGDSIDAPTMRQMASTEGDYYFAPTSNELVGIYNKIAVGINCLEDDDVAILPIGVDVNLTLTPKSRHYYKVKIEAGKNLLVSLQSKANVKEVANLVKIVASKGTIPTVYSYDYANQTTTTQAKTELAIAHANDGTDYLLIFAPYLAQGTIEATLRADYTDFHVSGISPNQGSNAGSLTANIYGVGFNQDTEVSLVAPNGQIIVGTDKNVLSNETIFATFNLTGTAVGSYTLKVTRPASNTSITRDKAVNVIQGTGAKFFAQLQGPERVRAGRTYRYDLVYGNIGDADMVAQFLVITSSVPGTVIYMEGYTATDTLIWLASGVGSPGHILAPGQGGMIPFMVSTPRDAKLEVSILGEDDTPFNWPAVENSLKPQGVNEAEWRTFFDSATVKIGKTNKEVFQTLRLLNKNRLEPTEATTMLKFALFLASQPTQTTASSLKMPRTPSYDPKKDVILCVVKPKGEPGCYSEDKIDPTKQTIILTHGWQTGKNDATFIELAQLLADEYPDRNVVRIIWEDGAKLDPWLEFDITKNPWSASSNIPKAAEVAKQKLEEQLNKKGKYLHWSTVIYIGHSFGNGINAYISSKVPKKGYGLLLNPAQPLAYAIHGKRINRWDVYPELLWLSLSDNIVNCNNYSDSFYFCKIDETLKGIKIPIPAIHSTVELPYLSWSPDYDEDFRYSIGMVTFSVADEGAWPAGHKTIFSQPYWEFLAKSHGFYPLWLKDTLGGKKGEECKKIAKQLVEGSLDIKSYEGYDASLSGDCNIEEPPLGGIFWGTLVVPNEIIVRPIVRPIYDAINSTAVTVIKSVDPNDKVSPLGVGAKHGISPDSPIDYLIHFENLKTATAPVQELVITDQLNPNLDWTTLQFKAVGYGSQVVSVAGDNLEFATRVFPPSNAVMGTATGEFALDMKGLLDIQTGKLEWRMKLVDTATNDFPADPLAGFLPPENGTGRGQGYVAFSVSPKVNLPKGTVITNSASIVFDNNPMIATNEVFNTLGIDYGIYLPLIIK